MKNKSKRNQILHLRASLENKNNKFEPINTGFKINELGPPPIPNDLRYYNGTFYPDISNLIS